MKIKIQTAMAFLVSLGFANAGSWDATKITERLAQVPAKVREDDVAEDFTDLYKKLVEVEGVVEIIEDATPAKSAKQSKTAKPVEGQADNLVDLDRKQLRVVIEEEGLKIEGASKLSVEALRAKVTKARLAKSAKVPAPDKSAKPAGKAPVAAKTAPKEAKSAKAPAAKSAKPKAPAKDKIPRDAFGSVIGSMASKVNAVLSKEWQTDDEIMEKCGLSKLHTRDALYYATKKGTLEYRRRIEYRLVPKVKAPAKDE